MPGDEYANKCIAILYPKMLKKFSENMNCDLYLVPIRQDTIYIITENTIKEEAKTRNQKVDNILINLEKFLKKSNEALERSSDFFQILSDKMYCYRRKTNSLATIEHGKVMLEHQYVIK